jgi:hypothetical protein
MFQTKFTLVFYPYARTNQQIPNGTDRFPPRFSIFLSLQIIRHTYYYCYHYHCHCYYYLVHDIGNKPVPTSILIPSFAKVFLVFIFISVYTDLIQLYYISYYT